MITGKQILELAQKHIGEKYVFGASAPLNNPNYKGPWDCAEFASWVVYQAANIKVGIRGNEAYTGYWQKDATTLCKIISIEEAAQTIGAVLFRSPGYKNIKIGHIAFSDGNGGTVEAKNTQEGVVKSTLNGRIWEMGLLINGVDYHTDNSPSTSMSHYTPSLNFRVTNPLMKHEIIKEVKEQLTALNLFHGTINDYYDKEVSLSVSNYQKMMGLVVDGILGKDTMTALRTKTYSRLQKSLMWFKSTFQNEIHAAIAQTPFDIDLLTAIAYQETGYLWANMIGKIPLDEILLNCTGDTLDSPNRRAFPKSKNELLAVPNGQEMFTIAREALSNISQWSSAYKNVYDKYPNKFCRGYGIFQYDLQFFKENPDYFLNKEWAVFTKCLQLAIQELKAAQHRIPELKGKTVLTHNQKVYVAIAYNKGSADLSKGFKQGHQNGTSGKYYGELIHEYYLLSESL